MDLSASVFMHRINPLHSSKHLTTGWLCRLLVNMSASTRQATNKHFLTDKYVLRCDISEKYNWLMTIYANKISKVRISKVRRIAKVWAKILTSSAFAATTAATAAACNKTTEWQDSDFVYCSTLGCSWTRGLVLVVITIWQCCKYCHLLLLI